MKRDFFLIWLSYHTKEKRRETNSSELREREERRKRDWFVLSSFVVFLFSSLLRPVLHSAPATCWQIRKNSANRNHRFSSSCTRIRDSKTSRSIFRHEKQTTSDEERERSDHAESSYWYDVESYWLTKEWIANCCLSNLDEKFNSLYRKFLLIIYFLIFIF
jgi:hypothetical protein